MDGQKDALTADYNILRDKNKSRNSVVAAKSK